MVDEPQDSRRGSPIAGERMGTSGGPTAEKIDVREPKGVDRLLGIAHDERPRDPQRVEEAVLLIVHVLRLVDHRDAVLRRQTLPHVGPLGEEPHRAVLEIAEVERLARGDLPVEAPPRRAGELDQSAGAGERLRLRCGIGLARAPRRPLACGPVREGQSLLERRRFDVREDRRRLRREAMHDHLFPEGSQRRRVGVLLAQAERGHPGGAQGVEHLGDLLLQAGVGRAPAPPPGGRLPREVGDEPLRVGFLFEIGREGLADATGDEPPGRAVVEDLERGVQPGGEGVLAQEPLAEGVDRLDRTGLGGLGGVVQPALAQGGDDPRLHLRRRLLREGDREDRFGTDPLFDDVAEVPLDEHARLARSGGGDDDEAVVVRTDDRPLLAGEREFRQRRLRGRGRPRRRASPPRRSRAPVGKARRTRNSRNRRRGSVASPRHRPPSAPL